MKSTKIKLKKETAKSLKKLTKNQLFKLLGVILLSDGHVHKTNGGINSIRLTTMEYNQCQHKLFTFLCERTLGKSPKIYRRSNKPILTSEFFSRSISNKLHSLSPTFQTTPSITLKKEDYLKAKQPTLRFIKNESLKFKWLALLTYFDFDGCIIPSVRLKHKKDLKKSRLYEYYQVQSEFEIRIAETNPNLNKELIHLCLDLGLKANVLVDKRNWSSIGGIRIIDIGSVKKFIERDTITQVKISSKSYRFKGLTKSSIMKSIKRIIKEVPLSKSLKSKKEAERYQKYLNSKLLSTYYKSPVV